MSVLEFHSVDGSEIPKANHLTWYERPVNNGISLPYQLVFSPDFERTINSILQPTDVADWTEPSILPG